MFLTGDQTTELSEIFRLLGDPNRLRIVLACLMEPVGVGELAERLALSPSLVSHHLRLLRAPRNRRAARDGKHVRYSAADDHVSHMLSDMIAHLVEPHDPEERS